MRYLIVIISVGLTVLGGLVPLTVYGQDSTGVEEQLEKAFEELDPEETNLTGEQLTQFLEDLASNPVNINRGKLDDLLQIPGINLKIARSILDYRDSKPFESKDELLEVSGIGPATLRRIQPYVTIGRSGERFRDMYLRPKYWMANRRIEVFSRYQQDLQESEGYIRSDSLGGYLGSPMKYYHRIRMNTNHLSMNLTQEKDAGEPLNGVTDFDFTSGHIALVDNGKLNELVVGDYSLSFGQGLVLWSGGAFGKGREVVGTISKNERGIKPYTSAQETDFFRGAAASYGNKIELTGFYSERPRTASVTGVDTTRFPSSTGFHRTDNELARKNNIYQMTTGGRLRADSPFGLVGVTGYYNRFSSYITKGTFLSSAFDYEGREHSVFGIDYRGLIGSSFLFGEFARSENGGYGGIAGIETPLGNNTELALAYRNYQKDFQSFIASGFGEQSSGPQNEEGFYVGLRHILNQKVTLSGYFDQYQFAAPRFGTSQSTGGFDVLALGEIDFNRKINVYVLVRSEIKDEEYITPNQIGNEEIRLGEDKRSSIRANFEYQVSPSVRMRSRVEVVRNKEAGEDWETGFLIYQDLRIEPIRRLRIDGRVTLFDTDSFSTRVYQFESDLLYVMSNTVLYDQGQRAYVSLKYDATSFMDIWFKYGITIFEDRQTISSGLNEVRGNVRNSLGIQLRLLF
ncbi:MAG: helix-hairpin-helix domain-containing protein [Gracilimonas sp.]|nr:helix-hairpin-helix domain-containing protein [Gracilimonas sp.]